ncbi:uncharacterized protein LOC132272925 [Cornus florida]|uniref:uncharacterized protein LOC132272925 n=1 Tax=Cornus florida TaxID=4283 RepID=UPI00289C5C5B|nr:uncharacterized protein LOC132272925 [Cornus florida]
MSLGTYLVLHLIFLLESLAVQYVDRHGISYVIPTISALPICSSWPRYQLYSTSIHWKHRRRAREFDTSTGEQELEEGSFSSHHHLPRHMKDRRSLRDYRGDHLRRSLRPRSHRIRVGISGDSVYVNKRNPIRHGHHGSTVHDIRVTKTSIFAHKSANHSGAIHRRRKRLRVP